MVEPAHPKSGFEDTKFLERHIGLILGFYEDRVVDQNGGFFQAFRDNGEVYDPSVRHLVGSARFVFNYATAHRLQGKSHYLDRAGHGLDFLNRYHRQSEGHFAWELRDGAVSDGRAMAYGHAFVMLAAASALRAGLDRAGPLIGEMWDFVDRFFWDARGGAYADERDPTLQHLSPYRGQNANMHMCEALLAAWEATGEARYLDRAVGLAGRFAGELAGLSDGLIWEHYTTDWRIDLEFNRDRPDDLFKPWGFQPGHLMEWAKLLLQINGHRPSPWLVSRATSLYQAAMDKGWDRQFGGLVYGFAPDGSFAGTRKYFWVQAEAFAAAWRLYRLTGRSRYLEDYRRIWAWSWKYLIDHRYGAWFRLRNRDGSAVDDMKSPPGKTDYHTLGACWDVLSQH